MTSRAELAAGGAVLQGGTRGAVAVGTLAPGYGRSDVEAFLAEGPVVSAPEWFPLAALLQGATPVFADLGPGHLDVFCLDAVDDAGTLRVTGEADLEVVAAS